jgi:hypothetical protein
MSAFFENTHRKTRFNPGVLGILKRAKSAKSLRNVFLVLVDLFGKVLEQKSPKYIFEGAEMLQSGSWENCDVWDGRIELEQFDDVGIKRFIKELPEGKSIVIEKHRKNFTVVHIPKMVKNGEVIPNHLLFSQSIVFSKKKK